MESMKRTKGRQSLKLKCIEDNNSRIVAFTKRRSGIFKKASEFAWLLNRFFMAASGLGMLIVRRSVNELIKFIGESEVLKYMKFFFEQKIIEERRSVNAI
ncbi:agamous-like MADS-box protein AGL61 [Tanacetum coccineum]